MSQRELRNNAVLEAILLRNAETVYKIAFLRTKNTHDAEDIMQEVFLRYVKKQPSFESNEHEKAWFIRTTLNRTKSFFTSAWKKHTVALDEEAVYVESEFNRDLFDEVMNLPKEISTAIHLYYYENMPIKDISAVMDKSESAVKSLLFRGRKLLKISLTDNDGCERNNDNV